MSKQPVVRNRFSRSRRVVRMAATAEHLLTQQQFKDECDMNRIVKNAERGIPPRRFARGEPHYGDFSNVPDLAQSFEIVQRAQEAFMTLPSGLRAELGNDYRRINELTVDQVDRYKLRKTLPKEGEGQTPSPASSSSQAPLEAPNKASKKPTEGKKPSED